jgi:hypothetical protein
VTRSLSCIRRSRLLQWGIRTTSRSIRRRDLMSRDSLPLNRTILRHSCLSWHKHEKREVF